MYKDATLRTYQYYVNPDWSGSCLIFLRYLSLYLSRRDICKPDYVWFTVGTFLSLTRQKSDLLILL